MYGSRVSGFASKAQLLPCDATLPTASPPLCNHSSVVILPLKQPTCSRLRLQSLQSCEDVAPVDCCRSSTPHSSPPPRNCSQPGAYGTAPHLQTSVGPPSTAAFSLPTSLHSPTGPSVSTWTWTPLGTFFLKKNPRLGGPCMFSQRTLHSPLNRTRHTSIYNSATIPPN